MRNSVEGILNGIRQSMSKRFLWFCPIVRLVALVGFFGTAAWGCRDDAQPAHDSPPETTTHASASRSPAPSLGSWTLVLTLVFHAGR